MRTRRHLSTVAVALCGCMLYGAAVAGLLDGFGLTRAQCEDLILAARVKAGWIDEADLLPEEPEETEEDGSEDAEGAESAAGEDEASGEDATAS